MDIVLVHDPDDFLEQAAEEAYPALAKLRAEVLFPLCQRRGVAVLAGGVFNSGILAGPGGDATYDYAPAPPGVLARALQFTLRHSAVTAAVVGARSAEEITADTSYLSTSIPNVLWAELDALFSRVRSMVITAV